MSETRGGRLSVWRNGTYPTHPVAGKDGRIECVVAFDFIEARATAEHERGIIEKLEANAAQMKKEAKDKT